MRSTEISGWGGVPGPEHDDQVHTGTTGTGPIFRWMLLCMQVDSGVQRIVECELYEGPSLCPTTTMMAQAEVL